MTVDREKLPLVLTPKDIQSIMRMGRKQTYELLKEPPFHVERVGKRGTIKISKTVFFKWLDGDADSIAQNQGN